MDNKRQLNIGQMINAVAALVTLGACKNLTGGFKMPLEVSAWLPAADMTRYGNPMAMGAFRASPRGRTWRRKKLRRVRGAHGGTIPKRYA